MENVISEDTELKNKINVDSSGIFAHTNDDASTNSIIVLKEEFKIDISSHKAKLFDLYLASNADVVLTMTNSQKNIICNKYPDLKSKTFTLKEYIICRDLNSSLELASLDSDISDPYGMPINDYKLCAREIFAAVVKLVYILKKDSGN